MQEEAQTPQLDYSLLYSMTEAEAATIAYLEKLDDLRRELRGRTYVR